MLDQTPVFDPAQAEAIPEIVFDQSLPGEIQSLNDVIKDVARAQRAGRVTEGRNPRTLDDQPTIRYTMTLRIPRRWLRLALPALGVVAQVPAPARASSQDANYATYQYGNRANLLGGAVVGSAVDVSGVFYNPGALARLDSIDLVATSQVFEFARIVLDGGEPDGRIGLDEERLSKAPGFFGGTLPFSFLGSKVLAYSVFTRHSFKATLGDTRVGVVDTPGLQGDAFLKLRFQRTLSETWFGLTYAKPRGRWGLGISQFVAQRSQSGRDFTLGEVFPGRQGGAISVVDDEFGYWSMRLLWKLGVSVDLAGFSLGLTATTPSVPLFGSGRLEVNNTVIGQDRDGDTVADPVFVADVQDGLSPTYKSPWSIGAGTTFNRVGTSFYISAEYFGSIGEYTVLDGGELVGQTTGDTISLELTSAADAVLNVNLGLERRFTDRVAGFASFWTDRSARPVDRALDLAVASWDIRFLSAGSALKVGRSDVTLGVAFGWGQRKNFQLPRADVTDEIISGLFEQFNVRYRSWRLMLALAI